MKKSMMLLVSMLIFCSVAFSGNLIRQALNSFRVGKAVNDTESIDVGMYERFSVQVAYEDGSYTTDSFTDGSNGSVVITLPNTMTNLIGTKATKTVNVETVTGLSGVALVINGRRFVAGTDYVIGASTTTAATALAAVIAAKHPEVTATSSVSTVTITSRNYGIASNSYWLGTSDASKISLAASTLTGGIDTPTFKIAGVTLTEKTDFTFVASSATSAASLLAAATTHATIGALYTGSRSVNVVTLTKLVPGGSPPSASCSTGTITVANTSALPSDIYVDNDSIASTAHGYPLALRVRYNTVSGTAPSNLVSGTTYFAIPLGDNAYKLATSSTNAVAGTAINISTVAGSGSFTMTPVAFAAGTTGFYWQAGNDGTNWTNITGTTINGVSVSSVTYSADSSSIWNFGDDFNYRYLRVNFTGPTSGALILRTTINGRN